MSRLFLVFLLASCCCCAAAASVTHLPSINCNETSFQIEKNSCSACKVEVVNGLGFTKFLFDVAHFVYPNLTHPHFALSKLGYNFEITHGKFHLTTSDDVALFSNGKFDGKAIRSCDGSKECKHPEWAAEHDDGLLAFEMVSFWPWQQLFLVFCAADEPATVDNFKLYEDTSLQVTTFWAPFSIVLWVGIATLSVLVWTYGFQLRNDEWEEEQKRVTTTTTISTSASSSSSKGHAAAVKFESAETVNAPSSASKKTRSTAATRSVSPARTPTSRTTRNSESATKYNLRSPTEMTPSKLYYEAEAEQPRYRTRYSMSQVAPSQAVTSPERRKRQLHSATSTDSPKKGRR